MNRVIGMLLAIVLVVDVAVRFSVTHIFLNSVECASYICKGGTFNSTACVDAPPPYPGFRGFLFLKMANIIWVIYSLKLVLHIGTFC
jgi:hypothetical protein